METYGIEHAMELVSLLGKLGDGRFGAEEYAKAERLYSSDTPLGALVLGEACFLGAGTAQDDAKAKEFFDHVLEDGSFAVLAQLTAFLIDHEREGYDKIVIEAMRRGRNRLDEDSKLMSDELPPSPNTIHEA